VERGVRDWKSASRFLECDAVMKLRPTVPRLVGHMWKEWVFQGATGVEWVSKSSNSSI
jgi:hypothetical protein